MTRTLAALALAATALLTGACTDNQSGDSNPDNQFTQEPGPAPTE